MTVIEVKNDELSIIELTDDQKKALFNQKVFNLQKYLDSYPFVRDGYNQAQKYEYVKANQYRNALRKGCLENGLRLKVNIANRLQHEMAKSDKMYMVTIQGSLSLVDVETGYEEATYMMTDGADMVNSDKAIYKAMTMFIKSYVQTTFLISDENEDDPQSEVKATEEKKVTFTTDSQRKKATETVTQPKEASEELIQTCLDLIEKIRTVEADFGKDTVEPKLKESNVSLKVATTYLMKLEEKANELGL